VVFLSGGDHRALHSFPTRRSSDLRSSCSRISRAAKSMSVPQLNSTRTRDCPRVEVELTFVTLPTVVITSSMGRVTWDSTSWGARSEEHTSELQSRENLVCRLLLEK